jgi:pimeloyl-ACP methyl ester carboxylesterase/DNA-binding winged helix-turn-helix (wHTH) protein
LLYLFENYVLDTQRRELRSSTGAIAVQPQVFDLLEYLIRNRERVVSKDDLIAGIWGGRIVSESTLTTRINAARTAIGDSGAEQRLIKTLLRKGVRFVAPVREEPTDPARDGAAVGGSSVLADRPSISASPPHSVNGGREPAKSTPSAPVQEVRFCRSGGVNIAVATSGSGCPVVRCGTWLTHIEQDWQSPIWSPLFRRLAEQFRLVRFDPRGCGLSDRQVEDISFESFVRDLETVVDSLKLERFALFGTSQGAAVSIDYAAHHPERVSHLVLSGGFALGWRKRGSAAEIARREAMATLIEHGWGQDNPAFRQIFTARYWPDSTIDQIQSFDQLQRLSASPENAVRVQRAVGDIDVTALLSSVRAPTLVLHCRGDATVPREQGLMLAQEIPNARFVEIDSRNHFPLSHEPSWERYVSEIVGFIKDARHGAIDAQHQPRVQES